MSEGIVVTYKGEKITLYALATQLGIRTSTLYQRWNKAGRPPTVSYPITKKAQKKGGGANKKCGGFHGIGEFHLMPDDVYLTGSDLARKFGKTEDYFRIIRRKTGKTEFSREEIRKMVDKNRGNTVGRPMGEEIPETVDPIDLVEYHPSLRERAMMRL